MKKYKAIYRDVGQIVIGELVEETKAKVVLKNPALLNIVQDGQSLNVQFIPMEFIQLNPRPISIKSLLKEEAVEGFTLTFDKNQILNADVELKDDFFNGYEQAMNPSQIVTPPSGLVDSSGELIGNSTPPKVHELF